MLMYGLMNALAEPSSGKRFDMSVLLIQQSKWQLQNLKYKA
jgi:hypothetical protein